MLKQPSSQENNETPKSPKAKLFKRKPLTTRSKIGWIAVSMLALLIYGVLRYKTTGDVAFFELNRTCVIMILLWLAWPELAALPRWLLCIIPICVGVCAWRPQYITIALPLAFFYLLLSPPAKRYKKTKTKK